MRSVHHTASRQSIVGGGARIPRPGEITLAHLGVLFLDEIAELPASTIDALRQPIENGAIVVSRVGATLTFPCRFTLVAAMNPCSCGYFGSDVCCCKENDVKKYQKKLSGPILDRIDLQVETERLTTEERFAPTEGELSPQLRNKIEKARQRQIQRFAGKDIPFNAAIPGGMVLDHCSIPSLGNPGDKTASSTRRFLPSSACRAPSRQNRLVAIMARQGAALLDATPLDLAGVAERRDGREDCRAPTP